MRSDPLVLGFDTSAAHCAAALLSGDRVLASVTEEMGRGQAERLFPLLEEVLTGQGLTWSDLEAIGVGIGPGNFTGIRLSVAAARGLALSLGITAVGVSGFEALTLDSPHPCSATIKAPRDQVYLQHFAADGTPSGPVLCRADDIAGQCTAVGTWVGDRAPELAARLGGAALSPTHATAEAIARIAARRFRDAPPRPAPLYVKPADAAPSRDAPPVMLP